MNVLAPERERVNSEIAQGAPDRPVVGSGCMPQVTERATPAGFAGNPRAAHRMIDTRAPAGTNPDSARTQPDNARQRR